tara:strand:- start:123 stop:227 length:105 start_codon:yes stop_codon:yes gene_type:complete
MIKLKLSIYKYHCLKGNVLQENIKLAELAGYRRI